MPVGLSIASYSACSIQRPFTGPMAVRTWRSSAGRCAMTCARRSTRSRDTGKCCARTRQMGARKRSVADLDKLLGEATLLLDRIDGLVTYSGGDAPPSDGSCCAPPPRLPHRRAWLRACSRRSARSRRMKRTLRPYRPSRILVVDDNASNRDLLSRRLQRQGHTVLQAEDGARRARPGRERGRSISSCSI